MKSRIHATLPIVLLVGLCLPLQVQAQACPGSSIGLGLLTPDGNPTSLNIGGSQTSSFLGDLSAGRSYSLDITSSAGIASLGNAAATLPVVARQPGGSDCSFPLTERTLTDPKIVVGAVAGQVMAGRRFTFLVPTSGHYDFFVTNNDFFNLAHSFTARLVETTLFGAPYFTAFDFETFLTLQNTTNASLNATVRFIDFVNPSTTFSSNVAVPANGSTVIGTRAAVPVATSTQGSVQISHDGPPGALKVLGVSSSATSGQVFEIPFGPR